MTTKPKPATAPALVYPCAKCGATLVAEGAVCGMCRHRQGKPKGERA